ncbi:glycosyltransferase [Lachnospiraceae bacterium JLR.KK008]
MNSKLISIIMPVGDEISFLEEAVESIMGQTYENWELIVVDSSQDREGVKKILPPDERIRYFQKEKKGVANALNYGLSVSRGEMIARMDADDIAMLERFERQMDFMEKNPQIGVLGTFAYEITMEGNINRLVPLPETNDEIKARLLFSCAVYHPTVMIRKSVLTENKLCYDETKVAEDYDLWTKLILCTEFANISEPLLKYRVHGNCTTFQVGDKGIQSTVDSSIVYIRNLYNIDLAGYRFADFYPTWFTHVERRSRASYVSQQFRLLLQIYDANMKLQKINEEALGREFGDRFGTCVQRNYETPSVVGNSEVVDFLQDHCNQTFSSLVSGLLDFYHLSSDAHEELCICVEKSLQEADEAWNAVLKKDKTFVLYGAGRRGLEFLTKYERLYENSEIFWKLSAIVDKKNIKISGHHRNRIYAPDDLKTMQFDFIVVGSNLYFDEIKTELVNMGISKAKIIRMSILDRGEC